MITDDMVRLRAEIGVLRDVRGTLISQVQKETKLREKAVKHLITHFSHVRVKMAKQTKQARSTFLDNLKRTVAVLRKDAADDLAGARKGWAGKAAKA